MQDLHHLRELLRKASEVVGYNGPLTLRLMDYKRNIALAIVNRGEVRLNRRILSKLGDEEILYILVHEVLHIKLGLGAHGRDFEEALNSIYPISVQEELCRRIRAAAASVGINCH